MTKTSPLEFVQQVRQEVSKVTWPTRKETTVSTVMVFIFVILTATFFFFVDQALAVLVKLVLGFGGYRVQREDQRSKESKKNVRRVE